MCCVAGLTVGFFICHNDAIGASLAVSALHLSRLFAMSYQLCGEAEESERRPRWWQSSFLSLYGSFSSLVASGLYVCIAVAISLDTEEKPDECQNWASRNVIILFFNAICSSFWWMMCWWGHLEGAEERGKPKPEVVSFELDEQGSLGKHDSTCVICMCELAPWSMVGQLQCGHTFHNNCISPWLERQGTCPMRCQSV